MHDFTREDKISVWIGYFQSEEDFMQFVDFVYDSDGESHNSFCQEAGLDWFDHDFQEANYFGHGIEIVQTPSAGHGRTESYLENDDLEDLRTIVLKHSWAESFVEEVVSKLEEYPKGSFNAIFLLFDFDYRPELVNPKENSRLKFIGNFDYKKY